MIMMMRRRRFVRKFQTWWELCFKLVVFISRCNPSVPLINSHLILVLSVKALLMTRFRMMTRTTMMLTTMKMRFCGNSALNCSISPAVPSLLTDCSAFHLSLFNFNFLQDYHFRVMMVVRVVLVVLMLVIALKATVYHLLNWNAFNSFSLQYGP